MEALTDTEGARWAVAHVDAYTYAREAKDGNHNSVCSDTASLTDLGK